MEHVEAGYVADEHDTPPLMRVTVEDGIVEKSLILTVQAAFAFRLARLAGIRPHIR
jgi:hypothetical protein